MGFFFLLKSAPVVSAARLSSSSDSTNLKEVLAEKITDHGQKVIPFRKEHGNTVLQSVTVDMVRARTRKAQAR